MANIWNISVREIRSMFVSPIPYIVYIFFIVWSGFVFVNVLDYTRQADMRFMGSLVFPAILFCPILAARSISEEKNRGTIELLLTSPVSAFQIAFGKYLASLIIYTILLVILFIYPVILFIGSATGPDMGIVFSTYLGFFLMGASLIGIGLLISSLTPNQVVAIFVSIITSIILLVINFLFTNLDPVFRAIGEEIAFGSHLVDFIKGVIDINHLLYFLVWIVLSLYLTYLMVKSHTWR